VKWSEENYSKEVKIWKEWIKVSVLNIPNPPLSKQTHILTVDDLLLQKAQKVKMQKLSKLTKCNNK
jgi:hypothetical protein